MQQINITLGTAGHIDHGKTALVKLLTGCETDRLKEEKQRGMSIDLGFAPCKIGNTQVGIVDVPGHENFIKTMVAGASGMDGVILVVAADDGVMPQTREHLEILTLLGIRQGIVALTKIDRVTAEHRQAAAAQVAALVRGTFLEGAPILPISNFTGEGFDPFFEALWSLVRAIRPKRTDGIFRLPLERAFSVQGYGTVLAGIPVAGAAQVGDEVLLLPQNFRGRIRRIEVYGQTADRLMAGQCAAINLGHWDHHAIRRGDTLTLPDYFAPQEWFIGTLRLLAREKLTLKSGAEVKFHTGTSEVAATFYPLQGACMTGGDEGLIQVRTKAPLVAAPGDAFILRTPSPVRTIGGGRIVEAVTRRLKGNRPHVCEDLQQRAQATGDDSAFVEYCVRRAPSWVATPQELALRTKIPHGRVQELLTELLRRQVVFPLAGKLYMHRDTAAEAEQSLIDRVAEFHRQSPQSEGPAIEELRTATALDKTVFDSLVARLTGSGRLAARHQRLALPEHRSAIADEDARLLDAAEALFRQKIFCPPSAEETARELGIPLEKVPKLLGLLRERGLLVQVPEGLLFHREAVARASEIVAAHFRKEDRLESVQFKYLLDTTRKFALPLLDYLDRLGVTRRVGNTRYPKNRPASESSK